MACPGGRGSVGTAACNGNACWPWHLHLVDLGYFRSGGEQYAEENESHGLATLLCDHVTVRGDVVAFDYPAKSGVRRTLEVEDPEVLRATRALLRRPDRTERFLVCRDGDVAGPTCTPTPSTRGSRS